MPSRSKIKLSIGVALHGFGLLLHIIGLATPMWVYGETIRRRDGSTDDSEDERFIKYEGLWKRCQNHIGGMNYGKFCKTHEKLAAPGREWHRRPLPSNDTFHEAPHKLPSLHKRLARSSPSNDTDHEVCPWWNKDTDGSYGRSYVSLLHAVRAMTILGAISGCVALMAAINLLCGTRNRHLPGISLGGSVAACVFIVTGVVVWGTKVLGFCEYGMDSPHTRFGYSLVIVLVGQMLMAAGGILAYIAGKALLTKQPGEVEQARLG